MEKPTNLQDSLLSLPAELRRERRWIVWKVSQGGKTPISPITGYPAACNNPAHWADYDTAALFKATNGYDAIGIVLSDIPGFTPITIVDFDHVCDAGGSPPEWVSDWVQKIDSYTERSASGEGFHTIQLGTWPERISGKEMPPSPPSGTRKVEVWPHGKMFALSGDVLAGCSQELRQLNPLVMQVLCKQAKEGSFLNPPIVVVSSDVRYKEIVSGEYEGHGLGRSEAVQSALVYLAGKHRCDREKMAEEFENTALCQEWESDCNGKWSRLRESELSKAIEFYRARQAKVSEQEKRLSFSLPPKEGSHRDYVLSPALGELDGFFPLGAPHIVSGPSGGMKTSLVCEMLVAQHRGERYLGHETYRRSFLMLIADRNSDHSNLRTLERLRIDPATFPVGYLPMEVGFKAAQNILGGIERHGVPEIAFVEGADALVEDANKMQFVAPFMRWMQDISKHYHTSLILSLGAPKMRIKEGYSAKRDNIFGSVQWGRSSETVAVLQYPEGDDMTDKRVLSLLPRNAPPEAFNMIVVSGRLVQDTATKLAESERTLTVLKSFGGEWFSAAELAEELDISARSARRLCGEYYEKQLLNARRHGRAKGKQYRWAGSTSSATQSIRDKNQVLSRCLSPIPNGDKNGHDDTLDSGEMRPKCCLSKTTEASQ
jgi:hypothetical protein